MGNQNGRTSKKANMEDMLAVIDRLEAQLDTLQAKVRDYEANVNMLTNDTLFKFSARVNKIDERIQQLQDDFNAAFYREKENVEIDEATITVSGASIRGSLRRSLNK